MRSSVEAVEKLRILFKEERKRVEAWEEMNTRPPAERDDFIDSYKRMVDEMQPKIEDILGDLLRYPPHHLRHGEMLKKFYAGFASPEEGFRKSVFIMTKFPRRPSDPHSTPKDEELRTVIKAVEKAIEACGYKPRIADERQPQYHSIVWDEVELYLLGCAKGVAIVEDKYMPELNPNVALEWGWMRAMGRDVLFLQEESFQHARADVHGFMVREFNWSKPDVEDAVRQLVSGVTV